MVECKGSPAVYYNMSGSNEWGDLTCSRRYLWKIRSFRTETKLVKLINFFPPCLGPLCLPLQSISQSWVKALEAAYMYRWQTKRTRWD